MNRTFCWIATWVVGLTLAITQVRADCCKSGKDCCHCPSPCTGKTCCKDKCDSCADANGKCCTNCADAKCYCKDVCKACNGGKEKECGCCKDGKCTCKTGDGIAGHRDAHAALMLARIRLEQARAIRLEQASACCQPCCPGAEYCGPNCCSGCPPVVGGVYSNPMMMPLPPLPLQPPMPPYPYVATPPLPPLCCCVLPPETIPCKKAEPCCTIKVTSKDYPACLEIHGDGTSCMSCKKMYLTMADGSELKVAIVRKLADDAECQECTDGCDSSECQQVKITADGLKATADKVVTNQKDRVVLDGHVHLSYHKKDQHARVTADKVTVKVCDGELVIKTSGAAAE